MSLSFTSGYFSRRTSSDQDSQRAAHMHTLCANMCINLIVSVGINLFLIYTYRFLMQKSLGAKKCMPFAFVCVYVHTYKTACIHIYKHLYILPSS